MNGCAILLPALLCSVALRGQVVMESLRPGGTGRLFPSDATVLEAREPRTSLPCTVKPKGPELDFDFTFRFTYEVTLSLRDLADAGDHLTGIFRVTSDGKEGPVYFEQKVRVPPVQENAEGVAAYEGGFLLGEGDYQVDWLVRDTRERVCAAFWRISARPPAKERWLGASLAPGEVRSITDVSVLDREDPDRSTRQPLSVAVLLNVGPQAGATTTAPGDSRALLSILRGIAMDPRIDSLSVTAFNLQTRQVILRQENVRRVDFADLNEAIDSLRPGTISVSELAEENGEAKFLVGLAGEQFKRQHTDALILVGPTAGREAVMTRDLSNQLGETTGAIFYLNYNTAPAANPWRDLIGSAVKYWKGREFIISKPLDLVSAWSKIMSQLGRAVPWRNGSAN